MSLAIRAMTPLLQVFDMERSIAFYRDGLGFHVVETSTPTNYDWALLSGDGGAVSLMLNTAYEADERPPSPDPARVVAHADTTLYFACDDPDSAYELLRSRGLDPRKPATAPYGMRQVYLRDPDGYELCFQRPAGDR